jgi:hypothetical protein
MAMRPPPASRRGDGPEVEVLASGIKSGPAELYELASRVQRMPLSSGTGKE